MHSTRAIDLFFLSPNKVCAFVRTACWVLRRFALSIITLRSRLFQKTGIYSRNLVLILCWRHVIKKREKGYIKNSIYAREKCFFWGNSAKVVDIRLIYVCVSQKKAVTLQQIFNWSNMKMSKCKKLFTFLLAALALTACTNTNEKMSKCENEKLELSFSAEQAACMSAIALRWG